MNKSTSLLILFLALSVLNLSSCKKEELPTVLTSSIANITATSASSGGVISSDGGAKVTSRGVCWGLSANPSISDSKTSDGGGDGQFTSNITGLEAGSTYHVRAYATNSVGTAYGADLSFTTLGNAPECITQPAGNISPTGVTLNGTVNANHASTIVTFEYGTTNQYGKAVTAVQSPVNGNSITNVSFDLTGLTEGTTYHFRVNAVNSIGSDVGEDMTFTTSGQTPEATTQSSTNVSTVSATLNGAVNANHASTMVTFDYGTTEAYGNSVVATPNPVTGNTSTIVSADVAGLHPGTEYHFRVKAVSSFGTVYGEDVTFTTLGQVPTVVTREASNVQVTTATMNGTVNANHLPTVFSFEYGSTTSYGYTASPAQNQLTGYTDVNASINLIGLDGGTTYHYRVVATNQLGTTYGDDVSFTTDATITLSTNPISGVTYSSAVVGGNITNEGGSSITSRGVCWSKNPNPTTSNDYTIDGAGTGSFTSQIKCLDEMSIYYVRAYATNSEGTVYGDQRSFTTEPCPIAFNPTLIYGKVDDIDGNCYKTIQIGDQIWMAENLKTSRYNDGTPILNVTDNTEWENLLSSITDPPFITTAAYCWYNNDSATYENVYGKLYNYGVVSTAKICPVGWHVPSWIDPLDGNPISEDCYFNNYLGGKLIETGSSHWINPYSACINNETGFTAVPAGKRNSDGTFTELGYTAYFWVPGIAGIGPLVIHQKVPHSPNYCLSPSLCGIFPTEGLSIRCVKD